MGDRIVFNDGSTALLGSSSETAFLKSTGLSNSVPLISSSNTLVIQNISLSASYAASIGGISTAAYDWRAVNFLDCEKIDVGTCSNFIYESGAFLNSSGLEFGGTIGTVGIFNSLFAGRVGETNITLLSGLNVTRRFRLTYSSVFTNVGGVGINVSENATIPVESYILDTIAFSGPGTNTSGVPLSSNEALVLNCVGVENTSTIGELYANDNVTNTPISVTDTFVKVLGATSGGYNRKFTTSDNRLTCGATITRQYTARASVSFTGTNNNVYKFGIYNSKTGNVYPESIVKTTANASGRAENVHMFAIDGMSSGDFIEVWAANTTGTNDLVVTDFHLAITTI